MSLLPADGALYYQIFHGRQAFWKNVLICPANQDK
jgi:hypothetical protein